MFQLAFLPLTKKTRCRSAPISMSPISPASSGSTDSAAEHHTVIEALEERKGSAGRRHRHYRAMHRRLLLLRLQNATCTLKNNATRVSFSIFYFNFSRPVLGFCIFYGFSVVIW
jgi:hypothetical protein